jgi:hypothetical protein
VYKIVRQHRIRPGPYERRHGRVLVPAALVMIRGLRTLAAPINTTPVGTPVDERARLSRLPSA